MHPSYYHRAHACVLVFDVTRKATYKSLTDWYGELRQYCEGIPCLLVANKIDVDYNVREGGRGKGGRGRKGEREGGREERKEGGQGVFVQSCTELSYCKQTTRQ